MDRRRFLTQMSLLATAATWPAGAMPRWGHRAQNEYVVTETRYGKVRGVRREGVNTFKGIPYAGSASGAWRFKRPAPLQPWAGVRDALALGAPAIQSPRRDEPLPSEDCLFLNIWTPANDSRKRPVMFYNHGGGFVIGSGGARGQDGTNLARNFDVVVVQTNHRLGLLGFLYLAEVAGAEYAESGNIGTLDMAAGLKWVNANIEQFGGDPNNVMIFGESGGGAKTSCLYAMPEAAPFYNKASIESGPGVRMMSQEMAAATTRQVLKELGLAPKDWHKLLEIPASDLLAVQAKLPFVAPFQQKNRARVGVTEPRAGGFGPVVDGLVLPAHPFDPVAPAPSKDKPLLVGWNEDEYTFFAWERKDTQFAQLDFAGLKQQLLPQLGDGASLLVDAYRESRPNASAADIFVAIQSIAMMGLGSIEIAEKKALQGGAPVYLYNFGYKSEKKIPGTDYPMGTPHAMDITFKFNNEVPPPTGSPDGESFFGGGRPERFVASRNFATLWTSFARTGKPSTPSLPDWPAFNTDTRATMRIDTNCEVIYNRFDRELKAWRELGFL